MLQGQMGRESPFSFQWRCDRMVHLCRKKLIMGKFSEKKVVCWFLGPTYVPKINVYIIIP